MDKEHRKKATRENCYVKKSGVFLPCPEGMELSEEAYVIFQREQKEKALYLEWEEHAAAGPPFSEEFWNQYVHKMWKCRR